MKNAQRIISEIEMHYRMFERLEENAITEQVRLMYKLNKSVIKDLLDDIQIITDDINRGL